MTSSRFRRHRSGGGRQPVFGGDFPGDDGLSITEAMQAVQPEWDGATFGLPAPAPPGQDTQPLGGLRSQPRYMPPGVAPHLPSMPRPDPGGTGPLAPLRAVPPAPDMFPALQELPAPSPEPAQPQRRPDCAIFVIIPGGIGLLCGIDLWRRHADPETVHDRHGFDALRGSALAAGWRPDLFGRWACPRCKNDPAYVTPQPLTHWHPDGHDGRGRMMTGHGGYRDAQFWLQVEAENEVFRRTRDGVGPGRHRAGA